MHRLTATDTPMVRYTRTIFPSYAVHAQVRVSPFYEKQGYIQFGQIDDDEGVPHM